MKTSRIHIRNLRKQAEALAEKKRQKSIMQNPCPDCGQPPERLLFVDQDTGIETATGRPPCDRCLGLKEAHTPDAVHVIQYIPVAEEEDEPGPDAA
jgi:hypothetical protein